MGKNTSNAKMGALSTAVESLRKELQVVKTQLAKVEGPIQELLEIGTESQMQKHEEDTNITRNINNLIERKIKENLNGCITHEQMDETREEILKSVVKLLQKVTRQKQPKSSSHTRKRQ